VHIDEMMEVGLDRAMAQVRAKAENDAIEAL
jgi:hypothetical protein